MASPVHSPPDASSYPSRQNRVITQRQYRQQELECFNALRNIIRELTGEELQTRQEILRKGCRFDEYRRVIELLLTVSEIRTQGLSHIAPPAPCEEFPFTNLAGTTATQAHSGYSAQTSHWPQNWLTDVDFDEQSVYYTAQAHDRQHDIASNVDLSLGHTSYQDYGGSWPGYSHG